MTRYLQSEYYTKASNDLRQRADKVRDTPRGVPPDPFDEISISVKVVGYEIAAALFGIADALTQRV